MSLRASRTRGSGVYPFAVGTCIRTNVPRFVLQYGIKKKEEIKPEPEEDMGPAGLNRRKKTPEEIAAENEAAEQDELTSEYSVDYLLNLRRCDAIRERFHF